MDSAETMFPKKRAISKVAQNILKKRYYHTGENSWEDIANRVIEWVIPDAPQDRKEITRQMIANTYFIPNSPCLVNSGKPDGGLSACFVVDFLDDIREIYKTKLDIALIARKGGGCGFSLSKIRPEGSFVHGSSHGYAGGGIKFADTISHDMEAMTQSGFRSMALMMTESVYHPDIIKFINAKTEEGRIENANISVTVDDAFMRAVIADEKYWTRFKFANPDGSTTVKKYDEYRARDIFEMIVEGMWKNGEPGILFYDKINDSPYKYAGEELIATNPCSEQPLSSNGSCNLGSLDISKFLDEDKNFEWDKFEIAVRYGMRFLDAVIDKGEFPTEDIKIWAHEHRAVGLGIMGYADFLLMKEIAYGSQEAIDLLEKILEFMEEISIDESVKMGNEFGIPVKCELLPNPRRNITTNTVAPTGTISLIAGCVIGDTEIHTIEGKKKIKDIVGTEQFVYASDKEEIVVKKARDIRKTRENAEVWKIKFDTDDELILTPDHKVMLSNGEWKRTDELKFGDSVRAFSKSMWTNQITSQTSTALYMTNLPRKLNHRAIAECKYNRKIRKDEVVHHINFDHTNDSIGNLEIIKAKKHREIHSVHISDWAKNNIGKTYEEIFGEEKAREIKDTKSQKMSGEGNHRYGYKLSDRERQIISAKTKEAMWKPEIREKYLNGMKNRNHKVISASFYGHEDVYNMEVDDVENYVANGVVVHNCSSGIEPIFSEITVRNDKTGTYTFENDLASKDYFRCAVSSNGTKEVTWEEHIDTLAGAQRHIQSGVSKTINFPNSAKRDSIANAVIRAWQNGCKGIAVYRNGSRKVEVLSPKNVQKELCPVCGREMVRINGKDRCIFCSKDDVIEKTSTYYD